MLRKRSRAVGGKQALMSDSQSLPSSSIGNHLNKPSVSVFPSPRLFVGYPSKGFSDSEAPSMSPTSILESKHFSSIANLLFSDRHPKKPPFEPAWENGGSKAVGLGIVDALNGDEDGEESSSSGSGRRMVLFGSKLKIQVPSIHHPSTASIVGSLEVPSSPIEFGIKNKDSQLALFSPAPRSSPRVVIGSISASDMELSEDYTCVIIHGPNPRTTHIFDDCVVETCGDRFIAAAAAMKEENSSMADSESYPLNDFLNYCDTCKKKLGQGKETFMYRGEKAFCSSECRYQAILLHERSSERRSIGSSIGNELM